MDKKFNLSDKVRGEVCHGDKCTHDIKDILDLEDVKEFIKTLKERLIEEGYIIPCEIIDELAGEKLI